MRIYRKLSLISLVLFSLVLEYTLAEPESSAQQRHTAAERQGVDPQRGRLGFRPRVVQLNDGQSGIRLFEIGHDGPAEEAGLKVGDIILAINGETFHFENDLEMISYLSKFKAGDRLSLRLHRAGKEHSVNLTAEVMSEDRRARLARWMASADSHLAAVNSLEYCEDSENPQTEEAVPRGWSELLRAVTAGPVELTVSKLADSTIGIEANEENILPKQLGVEDLLPHLALLAEELRPEDSFGLVIERAGASGMWTIVPKDLPAYFKPLTDPQHAIQSE